LRDIMPHCAAGHPGVLPSPAVPDLIPLQEAAKEAGVDRKTIYRWIGKGDLTKYRGPIGDRLTYVSRRQLRRLLKPRPE
jgi:hypothetical protein